ncbi:hypothetical protein IBX65_02695 [Candidatus Aerophobetes bacterium]|nr:hypothetical protein [Candidatus Aerophobetes bacterium]
MILAEVGPEDDSHSKVQKEKHKELKKFFSANSLVVKYLPWDEHSVHMTIDEEGSGIYFHRKYKSPIFTPILVSRGNKKDCEILKAEFKLFNQKAREES